MPAVQRCCMRTWQVAQQGDEGREQAARLHRVDLCDAHLRRRHHFHGAGDLGDVLHGSHALLDCSAHHQRESSLGLPASPCEEATEEHAPHGVLHPSKLTHAGWLACKLRSVAYTSECSSPADIPTKQGQPLPSNAVAAAAQEQRYHSSYPSSRAGAPAGCASSASIPSICSARRVRPARAPALRSAMLMPM